MADEFTTLKSNYEFQVPAHALFFTHVKRSATPPLRRALRLEVPDLGLEFTDNRFIYSADPQGTFFYSSIKALSPDDDKNHYKISRILNPIDNRPCALIEFYTDVNKPNDCYAKFLAYDPDETVKANDMEGWTHDGHWSPVELASVPAEISKEEGASEWTFTAKAVGVKGTTADSQKWLPDRKIAVRGNLWFQDLAKFKTSIYASYNNDRIVFFYPSDGAANSGKEVGDAVESDENALGYENPGKTVLGYFLPFTGQYLSPNDNLGITALDTKIFGDFFWKSS